MLFKDVDIKKLYLCSVKLSIVELVRHKKIKI